jgi:hypothetical protein
MRISSVFSFVITAQLIARINCSKNLPKKSCCYHLSTSRIASIPSSRSIVIQTIENGYEIYPRSDADPTDTDHLVRIFKARELVTTSTTVRASWKKAGFEDCKLDDTFQLLVNDGKI